MQVQPDFKRIDTLIRSRDLPAAKILLDDIDPKSHALALFYRARVAFQEKDWQVCADNLDEYFADGGRAPGPAALKMYKQVVENIADRINGAPVAAAKPAAPPRPPGKALSRYLRQAMSEITDALGKGDIDTAAALCHKLDKRGSLIEKSTWHDQAEWAKAAHFYFAVDKHAACRNFLEETLEVSVDYGYLTWPRRIQDHIRGKKVLDVGCAFGSFGSGFLAAGARSYTGLDPVMDLDSTKAKNKRIRQVAHLPLTPREIMERAPDIHLIQGKSEDIALGDKFDTISLHNVTEHLIQIEAVFDGLIPLCTPETKIIFNHHNYFCWNGHHQHPKTFAAYRPDNPAHRAFDRWQHIDAAARPDDGSYIFTHLNRIRLDEFRAMLEKRFRIVAWDERLSPKDVANLLTPEIVARVRQHMPDLTERDLLTNTVFGIVQLK